MPSSFTGFDGEVIYTLKAKLRQSVGLPSKAKATFNFVSKPDMSIPQLMSPQYGKKSKKMMLFTSGNASINISTERMGYMPGEGLKIVAEIENNSSRALTPKYVVYQKQSCFAREEKRVSTNNIIKEVGEPVPPSTNQKITKVLNIPPELPTSILNCQILKVEYKLKVYLDIPYAIDLEIKVPLVILPAHGFSHVAQPGTSTGFQQHGNSNQPGWNNYPPQSAPGPYAPQFSPGVYPSQNASGTQPPEAPTGIYPSFTNVERGPC